MTDLQTKMERCAAGLLLQALTERYYKDDAGEAGDCVPNGAQ